jgi:hypothetical protein
MGHLLLDHMKQRWRHRREAMPSRLFREHFHSAAAELVALPAAMLTVIVVAMVVAIVVTVVAIPVVAMPGCIPAIVPPTPVPAPVVAASCVEAGSLDRDGLCSGSR